jgi:TorA maturation chaperone TorD
VTLTASEARQQLVDAVNARSFVYRFLAKGFEFPNAKGWHWLSNPAIQTSFCSAVRKLEPAEASLRRCAQQLVLYLHPGQFEPFREDYISLFSTAATNACPMNESAYVNEKPCSAAVFREFGLELAADERADHLCTELEFMSMLAAQEAYALERHWAEQQKSSFEAQSKFIEKHLGRWASAFCGRVGGRVGPGVLASLANFVEGFVVADCGKLGVRPDCEVAVQKSATALRGLMVDG